MRVLYLLRHGDAAPTAPGGNDHDRPLAAAARRGLPPVLGRLAAGPVPPTLLLCSSARRAVETLALARPHAAVGHAVEVDRGLYLADSDEVLARVRAVDGAHRGVLVVGHNPGLGWLAHSLARSDTGPDGERLQRGFAAGALAVLRFEAADWQAVAPGRGALVGFTTPGDFDSTR
jgi:phosphohistidine phosphatase